MFVFLQHNTIIMDLIYKPFPWYLSGFLIGMVMLLLIYLGKNFGMSSNLRTACSVFGAGKCSGFFKFDRKAQRWNLVVVLGAMIGGFIAVHFLSDGSGVNINPETISQLGEMHIDAPGGKLLPDALFGMKNAFTVKGLLILLAGGFLVGFGARYAGGCTSGHAISGISNLQLPSLIAVIGFFLGGLLMAHFILPLIF